MISAGILITGNEVLSAKTKDTNGPFMGMHFRKAGISVRASMMCGDNEKDLLDCLNYLAEKCDIILMTGGLGPTSDDLTAEVVAKFFSLPLLFNQEAWDACVDFFIKSGRNSIPESNKKQAQLPKNCELIANKFGTACGFVTSGEKFGRKVTVYSLPGVPYEMEAMFLNYVLPNLVKNTINPMTLSWQVFNLGESFMQSAINQAETSLLHHFPNSTISYQAHPNYVTYSVSLYPTNLLQTEECQNYLKNNFIPEVQKSFGENILYSDEKKVAAFIIAKLLENKEKISFAETSCAGFLSKELSVLSSDESFFSGAIAVNNSYLTTNLLKIPENIFNKKYEDPLNYINYLASQTLLQTNADYCLAEFGFPQDNIVQKDYPFEGFYLAIAMSRDKLKSKPIIEEYLKNFLWDKQNSISGLDSVVFSYFLKYNKRHAREIQQLRAVLYLLCSFAKIIT
ncbi:MAG: competence/damage-inducible protein A [Spirobacillus cienkowskii]|jgi:nicotinamide-nucleotide amidase|uniref:Competence/damage-inducible protein A n=1 Tax=Spirobacillus cienkowskii TaxID=495820 RepID=A0A369KQ16_9BACT|nr:MAG: competence/damage-inducible protein A [Spirobacillus cienkowskii]